MSSRMRVKSKTHVTQFRSDFAGTEPRWRAGISSGDGSRGANEIIIIFLSPKRFATSPSFPVSFRKINYTRRPGMINCFDRLPRRAAWKSRRVRGTNTSALTTSD